MNKGDGRNSPRPEVRLTDKDVKKRGMTVWSFTYLEKRSQLLLAQPAQQLQNTLTGKGYHDIFISFFFI